jgi:hypothetical protein
MHYYAGSDREPQCVCRRRGRQGRGLIGERSTGLAKVRSDGQILNAQGLVSASLNAKSAYGKPSLQTRRGPSMDLADAAAGHAVPGMPSARQNCGGKEQKHGFSACRIGQEQRNPSKSTERQLQITCYVRLAQRPHSTQCCFSGDVVDGSGDQLDPRFAIVAAVGDFVGAVPCRRRQNCRQSHPLRAIRTYQVRRRKERRRIVRTHGTPHSACMNRGDGGLREGSPSFESIPN